MFCKKCGSTLRDNAKFCGSCGAVVEVADNKGNNFSYTAPVEQTPYTAPVQNAAPYTAPVQNDGGKTVPVKKAKPSFTKAAPKISLEGITSKLPKNMPGNNKLLPIIAVAAVVVLVLVLVLGGVFGGPAGKVTKAFAKSVGAFTGIVDEMKLPDLAAIAESGKYNHEIQVAFTDGDMEGLGVRGTFSYNQSGKEAALVVSPFFEDADLLTGQVKLEGSKIYVGCPELMDKTYIMVDTKTLGADLDNLDMAGAGMDDLSFDIFDVIDKVTEASALTKDQEKALEKAQSALLKSIEVEKDGKKDIKVNGKKISCQLYTVVIPQDAMEDYLDVVEDVIKDMDPEAVLDAVEEAGIPLNNSVKLSNDDALDVIDELKDLVDELGDVELTVGINGGYVVHVNYEFELYDTDYEMTLQIGGGDEYVNDIYFEMLYSDGDFGTIIESTGNHAMKKGEFTDETTVVEIWRGDEEEVLTSELTWKPSGKSDNFELVLDYGDEIEIEGTLLCSKDSLTFTLPELDMGSDAISVTYSLGGYKAPSIKVSKPLKFSEMDETDLEDLGETIMENAEEWAEMIEDEYPEFVDMIEMLTYYYF